MNAPDINPNKEHFDLFFTRMLKELGTAINNDISSFDWRSRYTASITSPSRWTRPGQAILGDD